MSLFLSTCSSSCGWLKSGIESAFALSTSIKILNPHLCGRAIAAANINFPLSARAFNSSASPFSNTPNLSRSSRHPNHHLQPPPPPPPPPPPWSQRQLSLAPSDGSALIRVPSGPFLGHFHRGARRQRLAVEGRSH
jgi:hypothetical protein